MFCTAVYIDFVNNNSWSGLENDFGLFEVLIVWLRVGHVLVKKMFGWEVFLPASCAREVASLQQVILTWVFKVALYISTAIVFLALLNVAHRLPIAKVRANIGCAEVAICLVDGYICCASNVHHA